MYLNMGNVALIKFKGWLTSTLDVFKCLGGLCAVKLDERLTSTLDVFKFTTPP